jgi:glutathione-regulated potassium-efflux system protein KefB
MRGNAVTPKPEPYVKPRRQGQLLNEEDGIAEEAKAPTPVEP